MFRFDAARSKVRRSVASRRFSSGKGRKKNSTRPTERRRSSIITTRRRFFQRQLAVGTIFRGFFFGLERVVPIIDTIVERRQIGRFRGAEERRENDGEATR